MHSNPIVLIDNIELGLNQPMIISINFTWAIGIKNNNETSQNNKL